MKVRFRGIDGLRAIAVLTVMVSHYNRNWLWNGRLGVDVFFVISGFVITFLLIREHEAHGFVRLQAFWMRRVLRLAPALGALLVIVACIARLTGHHLADLRFAATFTEDFRLALLPPGQTSDVSIFSHTWSLGIEEQFYLVWPALLLLLWRFAPRVLGQAAPLLALLAVGGMLWMDWATAMYGGPRAYFAPDTHAHGLLAGCALAFWFSYREQSARRPRLLPWLAPVALVVLLLTMRWHNASEQSLAFLTGIGTVCSAVMIAHVLTSSKRNPFRRLLESAPLQWAGSRSYGIYLWHYVFMNGWWWPQGNGVLVALAKFAASFLAAELSWRLIETPVQKRFRARWVVRSPVALQPA